MPTTTIDTCIAGFPPDIQAVLQASAARAAATRPAARVWGRPMHTRSPLAAALAALAALGLAGCAATPLDPYGRPHDEANQMTPGPLLNACVPLARADQPPVLLSGTRPMYPYEEWLNGKERTVHVYANIGRTGQVQAVRDPAEPSSWFATHAAMAMRDWKVQPAVQHRTGQPLDVMCLFIFTFDQAR